MNVPKIFNAFLSAFLISVIFSTASYAQTGVIEGQVTNTDQKPVSGINISLEGTSHGSAADDQGVYSITNVPSGEYTLVVSGVGYQSQEKEISITSGEKLTINITLSTSNEELQEIMVQGEQINKFSTEISEYVSKVPIRNIENPQVYNTVSAELLDDQVTTTFDDALKNAPGVFKLWESTGRGGDGAGYYSIRGFAIQPSMVNGLPSLTNGTPDPANIEEVELIKGPSGTLFGSSLISYGGLINVVTKKPYDTFGGEVSYKTGSWGLNRVTADINTPVTDDKDIFFRLNTAYDKRNSFQDAGFSESFFLAPSFQYDMSDRLSFTVNAELYRSESTNPLMLFINRNESLEENNIGEYGYDNELSYTTNDITIKNPTFSLQGQMNYQISDNWRSQTAVSRSSAQSDGYYGYVSTIGVPGNTYNRLVNDQNSTTIGTDIQQNFIGDFDLGSINNRMVVGFDFYQQKVINNSSGYITYDQIDLQDPNPPAMSRAAVDSALVSAPVNKSTTEQQVYSAYVSDVVEIIPQLSAMASLRLDHFVNKGNLRTEDDDYDQTTLSPKFGLIYQPIEDRISLFANYMNGFSNVAPVEQGDGTVDSFAPEQANQWETGIKANLFNSRLVATASYYDITVSDILRQDPTRENFTIQDGENYSRGFELNITAAPVQGLNITAGYSHNESEVTKTDNEVYLNRRPEEAGPSDLVNGWISYRIPNGILEGFGLGFGGNYASDNYVINRSNTGRFTLPAYTVFNGSVFYDSDNYRLDFKINNFSDEEYYNGWSTVNPQQPRSVTAGFTYKF